MTAEVPEAQTEYNFGDMGDEEFMVAWDQVGEQFASLRERLTAFSEEHQRRVSAAQLTDILGPMTSAEKDAAIAAIQMMPESVESTEAVGEPSGGPVEVPVPEVTE